MSIFLQCIATDIKNLGLEIDIEEIFAGNEIGSRSWEFKGDVLLVCLLLGEDLDLVSHLFVHFKEFLEFSLFFTKLLLKVSISV